MINQEKPCPHGGQDKTLCDICSAMESAKHTDLRKYPTETRKAIKEGKAKIDDAGNVGWLIP